MNSKTRRLFFALWPPEQVRRSIIESASPLMNELDGRKIQPHNLHITLYFIGQADAELKDCLHQAALKVAARPFSLVLDCFGHFRRAKIFWMGAQDSPVELSNLHAELGEALSECGYQREKRPYKPHISLMRKTTKSVVRQQNFSIHWPVDAFVLVESIQDASAVNYQVIERYPL
jgi:RNA 2',3'-cyclic 3'-phosphodiesterase